MDVKIIERLLGRLDCLNRRNERLGKITRYFKGEHDHPYTPSIANTEYRLLARNSITNWLPLISDTYTKALYVDGYKHKENKKSSDAWLLWQKNQLDSKQSIVHRSAINYGTGYVLILKDQIIPLSATEIYTEYSLLNDQYPVHALINRGYTLEKERILEYIDGKTWTRFIYSSGIKVIDKQPHNLGFTPIIAFKEKETEPNLGMLEPLIPIQNRINDIIFSTSIAIQYASFRQRYAIGIDMVCDEHGASLEGCSKKCNIAPPFQAAIDRLWVSSNENSKFGDFAQTSTEDHHRAYLSAIKTLSSIAQIPIHHLLGELTNLSADALVASEAPMQLKIQSLEKGFGEAWEKTLSLANYISGGAADIYDHSAQVYWRDSETKRLSQTADALGKLATMLNIPVEFLWKKIPGLTQQDLEEMKELKRKEGLIDNGEYSGQA